MSYALSDFDEAIRSQLGELEAMLDYGDVARWVNAGRARLGPRYAKTGSLTWAAAATTVTLPSDFVLPERIIPGNGSVLEPYDIFGSQLVFRDPNGAQDAGTAGLLYWANFPKITDSAASLLSESADEALVSYCLYRFFKRLASSRAQYRRYSTITGQNGVDLRDLLSEADAYYQDFLDFAASLPSVAQSSTYYGD